jgi:hypothetical protein
MGGKIYKWQSSFDGNKTAIQRVMHFTPIYEWEGKYGLLSI